MRVSNEKPVTTKNERHDLLVMVRIVQPDLEDIEPFVFSRDAWKFGRLFDAGVRSGRVSGRACWRE
jgi:hypothetical protein